MTREIAAMWMPMEEPKQVSGQVSGRVQGNSTMVEEAVSNPCRRSWIPSVDRMPPIVQFVLHAAQWIRTKCVPSAKPVPSLRLVGQLALGAKRHVSVVEVSGVQFLVGGGAENVTVIVPIPAVTARHTSEASRLGEELRP